MPATSVTTGTQRPASLLDSEPRVASSWQYYSPYLIFGLVFAIYLIPFMRLLLQGTDEGTLVYGAVRIVRGQIFARDFFEVMGPGTFYWLALFFKLFGTTFLAERICLFVTSFGTGLAMYSLSRGIGIRNSALPCVLLFGTYFGMLWPTVSHHVDSEFSALASVVCLVLWLRRRNIWLMVAAGACAGITTLIHQPKGILILLALLSWLFVQKRRGIQFLSTTLALVGGYSALVGLTLIYFWRKHAIWDLVYANVLWPAQNYSTVNVVPYAQGMFRDHWYHIVVPGVKWSGVVAGFLQVPFLIVAVLPGLLPFIGARFFRRGAQPIALLYWLCGYALWLSEIHRRDMAHLVFGSPLLLILCIYYLEQLSSKAGKLALQLLVITGTALAGFNVLLVLSAHPMKTRVGTVAVFKTDLILASLMQKAHPGDEIFAYPYCPMYYFLSDTINPTRYSLLMYNYNTAVQFNDVLGTLERNHVKYVIMLDPAVQAMSFKLNFPALKPATSDQLILEPYLEANYRILEQHDGLRIMERRNGIDEAHGLKYGRINDQ